MIFYPYEPLLLFNKHATYVNDNCILRIIPPILVNVNDYNQNKIVLINSQRMTITGGHSIDENGNLLCFNNSIPKKWGFYSDCWQIKIDYNNASYKSQEFINFYSPFLFR